jgi:hypothetical protein
MVGGKRDGTGASLLASVFLLRPARFGHDLSARGSHLLGLVNRDAVQLRELLQLLWAERLA